MNKLIALVVTTLLLFSCSTKVREENAGDKTASLKSVILDTDREFSALSEAKGLRTAFIEYIDSNGVLLRPGTLPLAGGDAMDFITQSNDTDFDMTWEPRSADVSASGDLGYTYGLYSVKPKKGDSVIYGSYVTIWKRQPDGKWKFILQSGNEGVE